MNPTTIYVISGVVVLLLIFFLIWALFLRRRMAPPTQELNTAETALAEAKQTEADLYAQDEYERAREALSRAHHLMAAKEYRKAKEAAEEAAGQARSAGKAVEGNKAEIRAEDEKMLADFDRHADELKNFAAKIAPDTPNEIHPGVAGLIGKWEIARIKVRDSINQGRLREAYDALKGLEADFRKVRHNTITRAA